MHALAKILARHSGRSEVGPGEIIQATPDYVMMHDRGIARATDRFAEMGGEQIGDPSRVVVVFDHFYPPPRPQDAEGQRAARVFMERHGITNFHAGEGISHVVLPEKGYAFPGALVVGTDSHTITNSAVGCFATGLGHSDIGSLLARRQGVVGVVTNGSIRDLALLRRDLFPVFCSGVCPRSPQKNTPGAVNLPVQVGGLVVQPGDIVVADEDGVAVVPLQMAEDVARAAEDRMKMERQQAEDIKAGRLPLDILFGPGWVDDVLRGKITEIEAAEGSEARPRKLTP